MIYHTSPTQIQKINNDGVFGSALCFSDDIYVMTGASDYIVYAINEDELEFTDAWIDTDECPNAVNELANEIGCSTDEAIAYITEDQDSEDGWLVQKYQGIAAVEAGFDGFQSRDEQGAVYIIPMLGKESLLTEVDENEIW